ncbi:transcription termination/antitermination factor NusG [Candidatus Dependentiae bacterium]|nr:transcription termination/antitermination factor NusG [Candidatus Dependentiae bacterium]
MKRWYVIQIYTGFEEIVKRDLEKRVQEDGLQDLIGQILIPASEIASLFSEGESKKEKIFPGYLLIQMEMTGDTFRMVSTTPRISRFLGGESPVSLSDREVERIFTQMSGKLSLASDRENFVAGSEIHICSGPFSGFVGIIDKVDDEKERLTVMVSIFGRMTPVELGFDQVKK